MKPIEPEYAILYVDDEADNLTTFKSVFRRNYTIYTANSGLDGLKIIENHKVDLIISDQRMPKMTGIDFLKQVLNKYPDIIRILMTGYSDIKDSVNAINEAKVFGYIAKPWNKDELKLILEKAFDEIKVRDERNKQILQLIEENKQLKARH